MLSLLLVSLAGAESRLQFTTDVPVSPMLDGTPLAYQTGTLRAAAEGLSPGAHVLVLAGADGRVAHAAEIVLPDNAEARVRWQKGRFSLVETVALPVPPATVSDVTQRVRAGGAPWATASVYAGPGGVTVTGGGVSIVVGAPPTPPPVQAAPPPPDPPSVVTFTATDGSWSNVRVDGDLLELRNGSVATATLAPGPHTVEVRDFMDNEVWAKGTLLVTGGGTIKIGIAEDRVPEVYNRTGAWSNR